MVMSQKLLDPFAGFNKNSQTGSSTGKAERQGLDRDKVEYQRIRAGS